MVGFKGFDMVMPFEAELSLLTGSAVLSAGLMVSSGESTGSTSALSLSMRSNEEPERLISDKPWLDSLESF
jgi:hypothetical protein